MAPIRPAVHLDVHQSIDPVVSARVRHGFTTACAALGWHDAPRESSDKVIRYGGEPGAANPPDADLILSPGYQTRPIRQPAPAPEFRELTSGERFPCFHQTADGGVDLLGEVFEWVSGGHELASVEHDPIGRIRTRDMLSPSAGLDPTVAWASRAIADLERQLFPSAKRHGTPTIAISHDIDYLPTGRGDNLVRLARNSVSAVRNYQDVGLALRIASKTARSLADLDTVINPWRWLIDIDRSRNIQATWNVVAASHHRRDPGYPLATAQPVLQQVAEHGEIGVHGSYESLAVSGRLTEEYASVRSLGIDVSGGRQHWLRYCDMSLFRELAEAGATWDSSAGFEETVGFRHGIASPYRRWDFQAEHASPIMEIPLVVMDTGLDIIDRSGGDAKALLTNVLVETERSPGAGASVLWHHTVFGNAHLRNGIADMYWDVIDKPWNFKTSSDVAALGGC